MMSFRSFQIFHAAQTKISMKHVPVKSLHALIILSSIELEVSQVMCSLCQQERAYGQSKNRWSLVSRTLLLHKTHEGPPSICQLFRCINSCILGFTCIILILCGHAFPVQKIVGERDQKLTKEHEIFACANIISSCFQDRERHLIVCKLMYPSL
jgi:hypothetical protein